MMNELKVWAPHAESIDVVTDGRTTAMEICGGGWWSYRGEVLQHGADYGLRVNGEGPWPDPRSAFQPQGIHGPSRWVDHSRFEWNDARFQPAPLAEAIIYELHTGTFTPDGTFAAAIGRLDHLCELGVTHVQLMPVAEFAGNRSWGYDGADLYAPHHCYGGPDGLKKLVDACHGRGLAVLADVVYNHLGPVGNYLEKFGPYFTDTYKTPWGKAVNLDGPCSDEVRRFFIDNALMWLRDYHFDGVRIDAVHAFFDRSAIHFLEQLAAEVKMLGAALGRDLAVIAESDLNDSRIVRPVEQGGLGLDCQWSDDFHHALHTLLTGERFGYYEDFGKLADLAKALGSTFVYDHRYSSYRQRRHGRSAAGLEGYRFVACLQNHDQIGNRGAGERIGHLVEPEKLRLGATITLMSPFVPLLFQGEEWAASSPFQYFTDFDDPALNEAVRKGRLQEFAAFGWNPASMPEPGDEATWQRSKLLWDERDTAPHRGILEWYCALLRLRRQEPDLRAGPLDPDGIDCNETAGWLRFRRGRFLVFSNFSKSPLTVPSGTNLSLELILASDPQIKIDRNLQVLLPPCSAAVVAVTA